ncbi:MAG: ATP-binding protein [Bacteroidota bacterium]
MDLHDGRLLLDKTMSDLGETVRSAVEACADDAYSHGVRLLNAVSPEAVVVAADHTRLRTAMEQVIANAIQATAAHGRVVVQLYHTSGPVIISVADTGVGIPSKDVAKVTDAFYRVDRRDGNESRLGLGLTLARAIAEMHDGSLTVASREGVGSVVVMRIPQEEPRSSESTKCSLYLRHA